MDGASGEENWAVEYLTIGSARVGKITPLSIGNVASPLAV